jgi:thiol-disulfide isomerase/thioredoxin
VLSSRSLKIVVPFCALMVPLMTVACDRQSQTPVQPQPTGAASAASPAQPPKAAFDTTHKGDPLPAITVVDPTGRKLDLASLKGKPVLINLWATWCGPCVAELPMLATLARTRGDALRVVTVSQDMKSERVAEFLEQKGGPELPPWLDPEGRLSSKYLLETLPTSVLYDASGREVWRVVGGADWLGPDAEKQLAQGGVD